ncbi:poly [ADP-ribose] polymerase 14-like, partial [Paramuricea clavata]
MDKYEALIIEVTGINANTSKDILKNYFSSSRRGGDIDNIEYIKGSGNASITFANAEDVKKALETSPHSLEESALTLRRRKKVEISENDKVFVEGISKKTTEDCLKFYMERLSDSEVKDI